MKRKHLFKRTWLCLLIFLGLSSFIAPAEAAVDDNPCLQNDVIWIERPVDPTNPQSRKFLYAFRYVRGGDVSLPVIVFLPGGPGESSIKSKPSAHPGFDMIYTDPRGVGCNADMGQGVDPNVFSTRNLASDVLAIIKAIGGRKYMIHGHSYGTILATVVAAEAAESSGGVLKPEAVVLTGTLGKAFTPKGVYRGFNAQWDRIKDDLPDDVVDLLSSNMLPFGASADQWGNYLGLFMGTSRGVSPIFDLPYMLSAFHDGDADRLNTIKQTLFANLPPETSEHKLVNRPIWCREIAISDNTDLALIDGKLVGNRDPGYCAGYSLTDPYDSANWQISSPVFYFQGAEDPYTTLAQAKYHFRMQKWAPKYFVTLSKDSHVFPLCVGQADPLWRAMANQGQGFEDALEECPGSPFLEEEL